jgi:ribose transport system ATP-binding protein
MSCLLKICELTKQYGPVTVLDRCSVEFYAGEIHALLGANGAGKSTLVKIVSGLVSPTSGAMELGGVQYAVANKSQAEHAGVQIVQQELNLIPTLSVAENLLLTRIPNVAGIINRKELHQRARLALDRLGLSDISTDIKLANLGIGYQQMVEIVSALDRECRVLILDEPTAALSAAETERLFAQLFKLREQGVAIIYISHRLDEITRLADRVTILRDGKWISTNPTKDLTIQTMVTRMSGEDRAGSVEFESHVTKNIGLDVQGYRSGSKVRDVSFRAYQGERLGIAGLVGAGRTELLRLIFGADRPESGSVSIGSSELRKTFQSPHESVCAGLAMVTEDRKSNGLLLSQSIRANTTLSSMWRRFSKWGMVRASSETSVSRQFIERLETKCVDTEQAVGQLSGGNQQKVVIAKWLVRDANVFFFDEPTRGIDVAARHRIYVLMENLAKQGKTLVIVSSDLDELMQICDRILVMSAGKLVAEFRRGGWTTEKLNEAAFAGYRTQPAYVQIKN